MTKLEFIAACYPDAVFLEEKKYMDFQKILSNRVLLKNGGFLVKISSFSFIYFGTKFNTYDTTGIKTSTQ